MAEPIKTERVDSELGWIWFFFADWVCFSFFAVSFSLSFFSVSFSFFEIWFSFFEIWFSFLLRREPAEARLLRLAEMLAASGKYQERVDLFVEKD